jgi:hypothetical protein
MPGKSFFSPRGEHVGLKQVEKRIALRRDRMESAIGLALENLSASRRRRQTSSGNLREQATRWHGHTAIQFRSPRHSEAATTQSEITEIRARFTFTNPISELLMKPSALTSSRKFDEVILDYSGDQSKPSNVIR